MQKIAIISDIHANITALEAVFADIESKNISKIYCLGDLVLKCANPDLVIDRIREKCEVILKGNCDELVCSNEKYTWTRSRIGDERLAFLDTLPVMHEFYMSGHLIRLFHASPYSLNHLYNPIFSNQHNRYASMELQNPAELFANTDYIEKTPNDPIPDVIGYGHIHTPNVFRYKNYMIFNTGSVGIPTEMLNTNPHDEKNKFSTMSSYAILEGELDSHELSSFSINLVRVPYDISAEIAYLKESNMSTKKAVIYNLETSIDGRRSEYYEQTN